LVAVNSLWPHCGDKKKIGRLWKILFLVVNS
jgi:hypothetical protein